MSDKKVIWLMGGLGNNLFQSLYGYYLETVGYDVWYSDYLLKENYLTKMMNWKIHESILDEVINGLRYINHDMLTKIVPVVSKTHIGKKFSVSWLGQETPSEPQYRHLFGYFQNKRFISDNKNLIKNFCKCININYGTIYDNVIHLRFGDSVWWKKNYDYYNQILSYIGKEKKCWTIVTDDANEARLIADSFDVSEYKIISSGSLNDFFVLSNAKKLIISPSTYSWWAAVLNINLEFLIIPHFVNELLGYPNVQKCKVRVI